jgi:MFS superfamily sulfate permease-like transporter
LLAVVLGIAISAGADLPSHGVAVIGALPQIAFALTVPTLDQVASLDVLGMLGGALGIMLVGFGSGIVTARSFAMKSHSDIDADRELFGFGAANLFSGLSGGFPVTASDSRTAVNFGIGGRTQLVALVAAAAQGVAVLAMADLLAFLPMATLGAILVSAAIDLIDLPELRALRRINPAEFFFAILTLLGVVIVGALQGVFIAIAATLLYLIWNVSRPRIALLGRLPGSVGLFKLHRYPEARAIPGLTIVTLESALVFFNADFVKRRLLKIAEASRSTSRWFVLDAAGVNLLDSTGVGKLEEVRERVAAMGLGFGLADLNTGARRIVDRAGLRDRLGNHMIFSSAEAVAAAFDASADARRQGGEPSAASAAPQSERQPK